MTGETDPSTEADQRRLTKNPVFDQGPWESWISK